MKGFFLGLFFLGAAMFFAPHPALAVNGADCGARGGRCSAGGIPADNVGQMDCPAQQACFVPAAQRQASSTASTSKVGSPTTLTDPLGGATLFTLINRVIRVFLGLVGALAFAVFVYAGILWMTAGSSDRVKQAKDSMKYAIIGLALIAFSFVITNFIIDAFAGPGSFAEPETTVPAQEAVELGN